MVEALQQPFFQRVLIAGLLASVACGVIGTYVVAKRITALAGGLSHSAFGGVGLGYLLGFSTTRTRGPPSAPAHRLRRRHKSRRRRSCDRERRRARLGRCRCK